MLSTAKIIKEFNNKLKAVFNLPVYGKGTKEGYKLPCFNTELLINPMEKMNKHIVKNSITINCAYLMETIDQVSQFDVIQKMQETFLNYLVVDDRTLHIKSFQQDYTGEYNDILEFSIDIDIYENLYKKIIDKPITEVDLKLQRKECGGIMKN